MNLALNSLKAAEEMVELEARSEWARAVIASWNAKQCCDTIEDAQYVIANHAKGEKICRLFNKVDRYALLLYVFAVALTAFFSRHVWYWQLVVFIGVLIAVMFNLIFNLDNRLQHLLTPEKLKDWVNDYNCRVGEIRRAYFICNQITTIYNSVDQINTILSGIALEIIKVQRAFDPKDMPTEAADRIKKYQSMLRNETSMLKWTNLGHGDMGPHFEWAEQEWLRLVATQDVVLNYMI
jgi:ABC-type multidrug transport system fused ATPase/permease subunit